MAAVTALRNLSWICGWVTESSLPLDRSRRLARHVVDHAVDTLHLVDDARCDMADEPHVERIEVRRHAVGRGDGAQADDEVVGAAVAHHADGLDRQDHGESLPDVIVEAGAADLLDEHIIGEAQDVELLTRDLARHADRKTGPGQRMTGAGTPRA